MRVELHTAEDTFIAHVGFEADGRGTIRLRRKRAEDSIVVIVIDGRIATGSAQPPAFLADQVAGLIQTAWAEARERARKNTRPGPPLPGVPGRPDGLT